MASGPAKAERGQGRAEGRPCPLEGALRPLAPPLLHPAKEAVSLPVLRWEDAWRPGDKLKVAPSGSPPGRLMGEPASGRGRAEGPHLGFCPGSSGGEGAQGAGGAPSSCAHPGPAPPGAHGGARPAARTASGQRGLGPPPGAPHTRQPHQPPRLYLQGPPGAAPDPGGQRGARAPRRGRRRGPRRRGSASLCRPPSRLPEWAVGRWGAGGRPGGGRGAAGRGLHPPLSTATAKARAPPGPRTRRQPPSPRPIRRHPPAPATPRRQLVPRHPHALCPRAPPSKLGGHRRGREGAVTEGSLQAVTWAEGGGWF